MKQTLEVVPSSSTTAGEGVLVDVHPTGGWSNVADTSRRPRGFPAAIPRSQVYYWSLFWQKGIAESRAALTAGDYRDFDDATELTRWLLSEEDE